MTAHSETFCDEEVRDLATEYFDHKIPDYDEIAIEESWEGIWSAEEYPDDGTITYLKDCFEVAKVRFQTRLEWSKGLGLVAYPVNLVLELPDGTMIHEPNTLIQDLQEIQQKIRDLRDNQQVIPCEEGDCVCNSFDQVVDAIENLTNEISKWLEKQ